MGWVGQVAHMGELIIEYEILVRKPEGKGLDRTKYRWEDNIKMNIKERVGDVIGLNWLRFWSSGMNTLMSL
jgi:hypothetical protein